MDDCLFCRIGRREIPAKIIYEDESTLAFEDINPQAPVHVLVVPRQHLASLREMKPEDELGVGHLLAVAAALAREKGVEGNGYRAVVNSGTWGGQTVSHLHVHLLGGRVFQWPPG
ncbi:MAG: histidine triad nucleotide-binding protein [Terriglobia bacterium]